MQCDRIDVRVEMGVIQELVMMGKHRQREIGYLAHNRTEQPYIDRAIRTRPIAFELSRAVYGRRPPSRISSKLHNSIEPNRQARRDSCVMRYDQLIHLKSWYRNDTRTPLYIIGM